MQPTDPIFPDPTSPRRMTLRRWPNLRLALLGLFLIFGAVFGVQVIEMALKQIFISLTEPTKQPGWEEKWETSLYAAWLIGVVIILPLMLTGMTIIPFTAYRAIRDFFLRRKLAAKPPQNELPPSA
ncbi:MAG: hypothetical protein U0903_11795 [Planctomycetales bacterium]